MILYLDTSALLKLWLPEKGSEEVRAVVSAAITAGTSTIAAAESLSAIGRLHREGVIDDADRARMTAEITTYWRRLRRVVAGPRIALQAGALAQTHALRGFDAVHLASALHLRASLGPVRFLCLDRRLNDAAKAEGFAVL